MLSNTTIHYAGVRKVPLFNLSPQGVYSLIKASTKTIRPGCTQAVQSTTMTITLRRQPCFQASIPLSRLARSNRHIADHPKPADCGDSAYQTGALETKPTATIEPTMIKLSRKRGAILDLSQPDVFGSIPPSLPRLSWVPCIYHWLSQNHRWSEVAWTVASHIYTRVCALACNL